MAESGVQYTPGASSMHGYRPHASPYQELGSMFFPGGRSSRIGVSVEEQEDIDLSLQSERATEGLTIVSVLIFFLSLGFALWAAFVWVPLRFEHGYPSVGVSPGAPGMFLSQRYTAMWIFCYSLVINYAAVAFLALAVATPGRITGIFLHYVASIAAGGINFISGLALLFLALWYCNGASATWNAAANSVKWCCVHASSSPLAAELCGAIDPLTCVPAVGSSAELSMDMYYLWMMLGAAIAFGFAFVHLIINGKLTQWRVWTAPRIR